MLATLGVLEQLFSKHKYGFTLTQTSVEKLFDIEELTEEEFQKIYLFLHHCGISFSYFKKVNLCGFQRTRDIYHWPKADKCLHKHAELPV